ncbi:hypothetical protein [Streptomyces geysiriensis]|uniref:hypothetical protein n=1 Tax=Streptomyces geysiriensis TaxID=68207 RepID=UPI001C7DA98A|nr:hypothetical protein [Streptomyces geysiriensis]MBX4173976.1 hypothetical protein [Streptomyces geysiriensis]
MESADGAWWVIIVVAAVVTVVLGLILVSVVAAVALGEGRVKRRRAARRAECDQELPRG